MKPTREQLLSHYSGRQPKRFIQLDCFLGPPNSTPDGHMSYDDDGHCVCSGESWELMYGADVRVFIRPGTKVGEAVEMLGKIKSAMQRRAIVDVPIPCPPVDDGLPF